MSARIAFFVFLYIYVIYKYNIGKYFAIVILREPRTQNRTLLQ